METRIFNEYKQYRTDSGWKFTHRRVAEKILGKKIPADHEVHHINKVKTDNRPENLAILTKEEHRKIHKNIIGLNENKLTPITDGIKLSLINKSYNNLMDYASIQIEILKIQQKIDHFKKKKYILESHGVDFSGEILQTINDTFERLYLKIEILESKSNNLL
jgi:hypothetical protein